MPWKVFKRKSQHCVYKIDSSGQPVGETLGCHATRVAALRQLRALYASEKATPEAPPKVAPVERVDLSPDERRELSVRYADLVSRLRYELTTLFPGMRRRPPVRLILPETLREYADLTESPLRGMEYVYASTDPPTGRMIFAPRHQRDLLKFSGELDSDSRSEVDAVKTVIHEVIHLGLLAPPTQPGERIMMEAATEVTALAWAAGRLKVRGERLVETLRETAFYQNRFPWFSDLLVALAGERAVSLAAQLVSAPVVESFRVLAQAVSRLAEQRQPDAVEYLSIPLRDYDENLSDVLALVSEKAAETTGGQDSLAWLIERTKDESQNNL